MKKKKNILARIIKHRDIVVYAISIVPIIVASVNSAINIRNKAQEQIDAIDRLALKSHQEIQLEVNCIKESLKLQEKSVKELTNGEED